MKNKVVIIGTGNVGVSYAYSLLSSNINIHEIVLIDINMQKAEGEALDLLNCIPLTNTSSKIKFGTYEECNDASIICITAGVSQRANISSRMEDLHNASNIFKEIVKSIATTKFNGIILVAGNPLDVMTYLTWQYSGLNSNKIIGSGTSLDSARLQNIIANKLDISPKSVHAYVIGEHGNSQFVPWSNAKIGLEPISNYLSHEDMVNIEDETRNFGFKIAQKKNYTCFGIASALTRITSAIIADEKAIICVSSYDPVQKIFISTPSVIGINGVEKTGIMTLNQEEIHKFGTSANIIRNAINEI